MKTPDVKPILFSGPMVRAILREIEAPGTGKTMTRRVLRDQNLYREVTQEQRETLGAKYEQWTGFMGWQFVDAVLDRPGICGKGTVPPFLVGYILYVREHWQALCELDELKPSDMTPTSDLLYIADRLDSRWESRFRHGMHMPRWASRLTLEVTAVKIERVQDISEEDALAEGVPFGFDHHPIAEVYGEEEGRSYCETCGGWGVHGALGANLGVMEVDCADCDTAKKLFRALWNSINEKRGFGWDVNPWVVAVSFEPHQMNVDDFLKGRAA